MESPYKSKYDEDNIPEELHPLRTSLSCQICGNLFSCAVILRECEHSFCSACVRGWFKTTNIGAHRQKNQCPACRTEVGQNVDKALRVNRSLQEAVQSFKELVDRLHDRNQTSLLLPGGSVAAASPGKTAAHETATHSRRRSVRQSSLNISNLSEDVRGNGDDNLVVEIIEDHGEKPITHRLPSRNYGSMKKKELKDLIEKYNLSYLKEQTLSTMGTEAELRDRLRTFTTMWNSELDSISPKTPSQIVQELNLQEHAQRMEKGKEQLTGAACVKAGLKSLCSSIDHKNDKADTALSTGNQYVDKQIKHNFDKHIKELKERQMKKPPSKAATYYGKQVDNVEENQVDVAHVESATEVANVPLPKRGSPSVMNKENNYSSTLSPRSGSPLELIHDKKDDSASNSHPPTARKDVASGQHRPLPVVNPYKKSPKTTEHTPGHRNSYGQIDCLPSHKESVQANPLRQNDVALSEQGSFLANHDSPEGTPKVQQQDSLQHYPDNNATKKRSSPTSWEDVARASLRPRGPWSCERCTFLNLNNQWVCKMCATSRPKP